MCQELELVVWAIETAVNQALLKQKKRNYHKVCGKKRKDKEKKKSSGLEYLGTGKDEHSLKNVARDDK